jgi:hypothetical protein
MSKAGLVENEQGVTVHVPMTFRKRSGRKEIIVPDGLENTEDGRPSYDETLVIAISRAHCWLRLLHSGKYKSINQMANKLKVNNAYMRRLIRFTLLAPDIVEAILDGGEPDGFSQNNLVGMMPADWDEQRSRWGFVRM